VGVTKGFAGRKFAGSLKRVGKKHVIAISEPKKIIMPTISFLVYKGWKGIISEDDFKPKGLLDPVSWRK
jgi:hypothetical protein